MVPAWIVFAFLTITDAADIELLDCDPADVPRLGGYGPIQDFYVPGDFIHYFCDVETFIGGNFYRKCEDTGDWSGHTPVCDSPSSFTCANQSSTTNDAGIAEFAVDGVRTTCTSTLGGQKDEWYGNFTTPGQLIRVMLFLPKGPASYEVVLLKANGEEVICGSQTVNIARHDWTFHNCPEPHNTDATGVKIRSLTNASLQICEIAAYVLTSPKCVDPHVHIENGRVRLDRKEATLMCDSGFVRSPENKLRCVREGVWDRKLLYCMTPLFENNQEEPAQNNNEESAPQRGSPGNDNLDLP